jgi:Mn-dependent DtxR family transcriptional regulator
MRLALRSLLHERQTTSVSWSLLYVVPKTSSAALERRGLVAINRYHQRVKLTPAGIRLAKELDDD